MDLWTRGMYMCIMSVWVWSLGIEGGTRRGGRVSLETALQVDARVEL